MFNPFVKPFIAEYPPKDGWPAYPYVEHAYTLFNMLFRTKEVSRMQSVCNDRIQAVYKQRRIAEIQQVVDEYLALRSDAK